MTVQLDESRLASLPSLSSGDHQPDSQMCVMEALAFVAAESWTDHPACCCPVIGAFCRSWNDALPSDADRDRLLKPLIPRLVGSRSTPAVEQRRAWLATDWLVRTCAPAWLTLVKDLEPHATALRGLPELISTERARDAQPTITAAWDAAGDAAWAAAWAAAGAAAWNAAGAAGVGAAGAAARDAAGATARAAAWAAAGAAAWNAAGAAGVGAAGAAGGAAAGDAAWAAARDAAGATARAAAWAAAGAAARAAAGVAAGAALQPTVTELQDSALGVLNEMLAVPEDEPGPLCLSSSDPGG